MSLQNDWNGEGDGLSRKLRQKEGRRGRERGEWGRRVKKGRKGREREKSRGKKGRRW